MDETQIGRAVRLPFLFVGATIVFLFTPAKADEAATLRALLANGYKTPASPVSHKLSDPKVERERSTEPDESDSKIVILFSGEPQKLAPAKDAVSLKTFQMPKTDSLEPLPAPPPKSTVSASDVEVKQNLLRSIAADHGFGLLGPSFLESYDD